MQFVSLIFILFIIISVFTYQAAPRRVRLGILLFSNIVFYSSFGIRSAFLLCLMAALSYGFHMLLLRNTQKRKSLLIISLIITLFPLIASKYFCAEVRSFFGVVGISFFTFKMISFLVETSRGTIEAVPFLHYFIYITFFPTITAGPIDRPGEFLEHLSEICGSKRTAEQFDATPFLMILFGYFEKVLIADNFSNVVQHVYSDYFSYGGLLLIGVTVLYTLQIYFDFAGYSYIARGLAKAYGFDSMENFNVPYFSQSIAEFWRRWHISLSGWLRDYVYIPLGGNRKGTVRKYVNVLITFAISGLWHGTGAAFLVWGLLHGVYQVIGQILMPFRKALANVLKLPEKICFIWKVAVTFFLVNFAWIFFAAPNGIKSALEIIRRCYLTNPMTGWFSPEFGDRYVGGRRAAIAVFLEDVRLDKLKILVLVTAFLFCFFIDILHYRKTNVIGLYKKMPLPIRFAILYFMIFGILVFGVYGPGFDASSFIYFQF